MKTGFQLTHLDKEEREKDRKERNICCKTWRKKAKLTLFPHDCIVVLEKPRDSKSKLLQAI